ncbi:MAG TPA: class I SAM-dependent methyltransferase [Thermomicrobiales bacterium]|nr:class I SAM-dependent methyltransferase [Thermomicrobiales bacterium]
MTNRSLLNPDPIELGNTWREQVEAEYEQVERLREWHESDYYAPIAHHFADDPRRTDDELLNELRAMSNPNATWLDIGAGGGRYALPLALSSRKVIAIDPSEGMLNVLRGSMAEHGIDNIDIHHLRWPEGSDELQADFSLAAHVGYDIRDINGFLDGMDRTTSQRCCVVLMDRAPSGGFTRLWHQIHGEYRHQLPGAREFLHLLLARGAMPEVRLTWRQMRPMGHDDIRESARRRLWLSEGSEKDQHLQRLLAEMPEGLDDFQLPSVIALITWQPRPA